MKLLTCCLTFLSALAFAATPATAQPLARTAEGTVRGVTADKVDAFLGIPFAAPPVGELRWRAPQPVKPWSGVRSATDFGPSCWQAVTPEGFGPWTREYVVQGDVSEDCLYLNVWAPAERRTPAPVLVWVYGGGFNSGSGSLPIYNGEGLARRGIVVVTINYRVNVFGFLAHPELSAENAGTANFGLQDVVAALRWVRSNIAAFGGDPDAVTLAGQSAGSMAVHALIAAPSARGLFHRAIAQSGFPTARPVRPLADAEKDGQAFAVEKGAPSLAELRAMPADALQPSRGSNTGRFGPTVDGAFLPLSPEQALRKGEFSDVAMLAGFTADEASALGRDYGSGGPAVFADLLDDGFGKLATRAAALYPHKTRAERAKSNKEIQRDRWRASLYGWARDRGTSGKAPVHAYVFDRVSPGTDSQRWGAFHSSEIPFVFETLGAAPERGFTSEDQAFSRQVAAYWVNFVKTGDPNGAGLPHWPALRLDDPKVMRLGSPMAPTPLLEPAKLRLIDEKLAASAE